MEAPYPAFSYGYDLAGEMISMAYPSGRQVSYSFDGAGRVVSLQKVPSTSGSYASSISYAPQGAITGMQLGNGLWETTNYNNRLQATSIYLGASLNSASVWSLANTYGTAGQNNGNVTMQQIGAPNMTTITQVYTYDGANRLWTAAENPASASNPVCNDRVQQWCLQYSNDIYGNHLVISRNNAGPWTSEPAAYDATTNHVTGTGWTYDTTNQRGTILTDTGGDVFTYDAEDRLISADGTNYYYDGDGRRVQKTPSGGAVPGTWYIYDARGELSAEYTASPTTVSGTQYLTADHLGSTRVVTGTASPSVALERHDFYPFGEEILTTAASPRIRWQGTRRR